MSFSVSRNKPTKDDPHFIARNLSAAGADVTYSVSQQFAEMHVDKHTLETSHSQFDVRAYADADLCVMRAKENIYQHLQTHWYSRDETFEHHIENGWFEVTWQGHELDLLILTLPGRHHTVRTCWLASESLQTNEAFLREVVCWNTETRGEVLVYNDDTWQKDKHLLQEIKTATLENLVLAPGLKEELINDLSTFFASRQHYERYGAPWKRGLLLVGFPAFSPPPLEPQRRLGFLVAVWRSWREFSEFVRRCVQNSSPEC